MSLYCPHSWMTVKLSTEFCVFSLSTLIILWYHLSTYISANEKFAVPLIVIHFCVHVYIFLSFSLGKLILLFWFFQFCYVVSGLIFIYLEDLILQSVDSCLNSQELISMYLYKYIIIYKIYLWIYKYKIYIYRLPLTFSPYTGIPWRHCGFSFRPQ